jgi:hypothetical protein
LLQFSTLKCWILHLQVPCSSLLALLHLTALIIVYCIGWMVWSSSLSSVLHPVNSSNVPEFSVPCSMLEMARPHDMTSQNAAILIVATLWEPQTKHVLIQDELCLV